MYVSRLDRILAPIVPAYLDQNMLVMIYEFYGAQFSSLPKEDENLSTHIRSSRASTL